jgi:inosose dehydratase
MSYTFDRREFIAGLGALGLSSLIPRHASAASAIQFGYAAITWGGNDRQAIEDVAAAGYRGIQLRSNVLEEFGSKPAALRELLERHRLTMVALSSGNIRIDPAVEREELEKHTRHARFVRDLGGIWLQLTDERPKGRPIVSADYQRLGRLLTELGKRTADLGVPVSYHNHMNNLGERPEEVRAILDAADPKYVKLQLDTAHYKQGGGDPVKAVREYANRLSFLHIKDLESPAPGGDARSYRFVELGRGEVDLKGVFKALDEVKFRGWAVVELDRVPDDARTPKESALISKKYLEDRLGFVVGVAPTDEGWTPLFDGATLAGWRGYKQKDASRTRWKVENGLLTVPKNDGKDTRGALDLITTTMFDQFELTFEWRVSLGGNSGVKYFVLEDMDSAIGHEYQIIDDERHEDAKIGPERQTAAFYDVLAASNRPMKPAGEFNQSRIVVSGRTVEHWLNGARVLRYELETPALAAAIEDSKFKGIARFGRLQKGHILLQDHGDAVWYRSIRIRRIGT